MYVSLNSMLPSTLSLVLNLMQTNAKATCYSEQNLYRWSFLKKERFVQDAQNSTDLNQRLLILLDLPPHHLPDLLTLLQSTCRLVISTEPIARLMYVLRGRLEYHP